MAMGNCLCKRRRMMASTSCVLLASLLKTMNKEGKEIVRKLETAKREIDHTIREFSFYDWAMSKVLSAELRELYKYPLRVGAANKKHR